MGRLFDDETGKLLDPEGLKSVQIGPVIHGGYSRATGSYVAGMKDYKDQLARKSDAMAERMGFDVNYQLASNTDTKHLGVSDPE